MRWESVLTPAIEVAIAMVGYSGLSLRGEGEWSDLPGCQSPFLFRLTLVRTESENEEMERFA